PTAPALRTYLAEFLGDRRVVDLPRWLWWPILHLFVLNSRPAKSAAKYERIWTKEGSPLKVHTEKQAKLLRGLLGHRGIGGITVAWAMRYGRPSVAEALDRLKDGGARRVVVLPLYPQYAGSSTLSAYDAVHAWQRRNPDALQIVEIADYHDHPAYIGALAQSVRDHWFGRPRAQKLVMSFHGIPQRAVDRGDPYAGQCRRTAELLAAALELPADAWLMTFQSRFGAAQWLQPYTQPTLEELARQGVRSVDVVCPGFAADCLETLEEIGMECRAAFLAAGGEDFRYVPCLNERDDWIAALLDVALPHAAP
ncbi:MAG TPA: ferrochelatase, partial [Rhodocyclaceae bacterium]|nr:ferrochelatase [Rhodocyclaceae bacterium]